MTAQTAAMPLPHSAPEAQGVSSSALLVFVEEADATLRDLHSFMLLRRGSVVAEGWWTPYAPEYLHQLYSLSKSFASTAAGLAIAEGHLTLDDPVLGFFPEDAPSEISPNLAAMRVRDLLTMSTGHAADTTGSLRSDPDGNWARAFLKCPVEYAPGTHFLYNSGATYMVSAIVQKVTGTRLLDYLRPRLLDPIGITPDATWEQCPRGIDVGGWGLSLRTEDIARFGQLYLQKGVWNGQRLLSESWIAEATSRQVPNGDNPESDWNQGYGFQFWRCRHNAYRGDGAFGQYCIVLPEQETVLAITSGIGDMQKVLNLVWDRLLPALGSSPTLPEEFTAHTRLREKLASLSLPVPQGSPSSPLAAQISGKPYLFDANEKQIESATLDFSTKTGILQLREGKTEHRIAFGSKGEWVRGATLFNSPGGSPRPIAATAAWEDDHTLVLRLCYYETPFSPSLICRFKEDRLQLDLSGPVSLWGAAWPSLSGHLSSPTDRD